MPFVPDFLGIILGVVLTTTTELVIQVKPSRSSEPDPPYAILGVIPRRVRESKVVSRSIS